MNVTIYSTTTCPYCKMQKDYLSEKGVSFLEKKIDADETAREEMLNLSGGFMGVPLTSIVKNDGSKEVVVGFDRAKLEKILELA